MRQPMLLASLCYLINFIYSIFIFPISYVNIVKLENIKYAVLFACKISSFTRKNENELRVDEQICKQIILARQGTIKHGDN